MNKEQFAVYEIEPAHGSIKNGIILGPFKTREEAETIRLKYGYSGDNYYVDNMNKEIYNQIIDKAYKIYHNETFFNSDNKWLEELDGMDLGTGEETKVHRQYAPMAFIDKCRTNPEFSEKWGLKIKERELSREERYVWYKANTHLIPPHFRNQDKEYEDKYVPTKLVTVTYNDKTIESYE
jgi:signal peptidase I